VDFIACYLDYFYKSLLCYIIFGMLKYNRAKIISLIEYDDSTSIERLEDTKKIPILFRNSIPELPSTTCGTFSIYKYPAKFIPQVIAYVLKEYGKPGMRIFDPFAGYGTVGLVSMLYGYDYELWDLNPMLDMIHKTATFSTEISIKEVIKILEELRSSDKEFVPLWSNINYWFPEEFLLILSKAWGYIHSFDGETKYLFLIPLLKVTRFFSWSDEKVHKLYRSKYSRKKIEELLKSDYKLLFYNMLRDEVFILIDKIREFRSFCPKEVSRVVRSGVDTLEEKLEMPVNILITSPPYLQAQEYIRSTKLELFWLGYSEEYIKALSSKEIPYRDVSNIEVYSETYYRFKKMIEEAHLLTLYERYFHSILSIFTNLGENVEDYMCIFVGPAKIRNIPIPIDDIIVEHLEHFGWKHKLTYVDKILSHVMFKSDINPATNTRSERIPVEHLIVLERK